MYRITSEDYSSQLAFDEPPLSKSGLGIVEVK
jgi:hypothetical protein